MLELTLQEFMLLLDPASYQTYFLPHIQNLSYDCFKNLHICGPILKFTEMLFELVKRHVFRVIFYPDVRC